MEPEPDTAVTTRRLRPLNWAPYAIASDAYQQSTGGEDTTDAIYGMVDALSSTVSTVIANNTVLIARITALDDAIDALTARLYGSGDADGDVSRLDIRIDILGGLVSRLVSEHTDYRTSNGLTAAEESDLYRAWLGRPAT